MTLKHLYILLISTILFLLVTTVFGSTGIIDPMQNYAWSENVGWINFYAQGGNIEVTDEKITGYAWSESTGWLNLAPSATTYIHNNAQGQLSGYAWGEGIGFIDFSGVSIDSDGYFHGYAHSDTAGVINFNCENNGSCDQSNFKVKTSWRPSLEVLVYEPSITPPVINYSSGSYPSSLLFIQPSQIELLKEPLPTNQVVNQKTVKAPIEKNLNDASVSSSEIIKKTKDFFVNNECSPRCIVNRLIIVVIISTASIYFIHRFLMQYPRDNDTI